jgi:hypothetical protein
VTKEGNNADYGGEEVCANNYDCPVEEFKWFWIGNKVSNKLADKSRLNKKVQRTGAQMSYMSIWMKAVNVTQGHSSNRCSTGGEAES